MIDAIVATVPEQWQLMFQLLLLPISWIPFAQSAMFDWAWNADTFFGAGAKRAFVLLPTLRVIVWPLAMTKDKSCFSSSTPIFKSVASGIHV